MARIDRTQMLRGVGLFSGCSNAELKRISTLATPVDAEKGEVLAEEGKPGGETFVITSGSALVTLKGKKLARLHPGDVFGEMALLEKGPRAATVTAETPMSLYVLDPREFSTLLEDMPSIGRKILTSLVDRLYEIERTNRL